MKLESPKHIYHGRNSTKKINDIVKSLNVKKVYLLCDPILKELGSTKYIEDILIKNKIEYLISTNVTPEPKIELGNEIIEEVRNYNPDLLIGLGGGSTLDLVKAAALIAVQEGKIENYLNLTGNMKLQSKKIPNILMPTTSGTSAEITDIAVFSLGDTKDAVTDPLMIADYAIIDSEYTYTLPPKVAAASSVDALTHAIEAYTSVNATPLTDHLAYGAIDKIYNNILESVWNKSDYHAKDEVSAGSIMAGLSFFNAGVAGVHALAYPLGGNFKIPHGESNAVLLPYVYDEIKIACSNKLKNLAPIFKVDVSNKNSIQISEEIIELLFDLVKNVGLKTSLKEYHITSNDLDLLTQNALKQTRLLERSPLQLNEERIRRIYECALNQHG